MSELVIADTGPLVALFDRSDAYHQWAVGGLGRIRRALITSESVVSEVLFLLRDSRRSRSAFLAFWAEGALSVEFDTEEDKAALIALLNKYADVGISLAEAAIVRLSERHSRAAVWTLDEDFRVYRRFGRRVIPLYDWPG